MKRNRPFIFIQDFDLARVGRKPQRDQVKAYPLRLAKLYQGPTGINGDWKGAWMFRLDFFYTRPGRGVRARIRQGSIDWTAKTPNPPAKAWAAAFRAIADFIERESK